METGDRVGDRNKFRMRVRVCVEEGKVEVVLVNTAQCQPSIRDITSRLFIASATITVTALGWEQYQWPPSAKPPPS